MLSMTQEEPMKDKAQAAESADRRKKVFNVIKNDAHFNILKEIVPLNDNGRGNEEDSESELVDERPSSNRLSAVSKVNFSKLSNEEKDERLKNLARLVKQLRKKLRKHEAKPIEKDLNQMKHIDNFLKANKLLHSYGHFKLNNTHKVLEILISLIADGKLDFNSIYFKKIVKQIKRCMTKSSPTPAGTEPLAYIDSSLEGKTLTKSTSSASLSNTHTQQPDYALFNPLNYFNSLPTNQHLSMGSMGFNVNNINPLSKAINYPYYHYLSAFANTTQQATSTFNLNQQLLSKINFYQPFKLPF